MISVSVWNKAVLNWSGPHLLSSPLTQDPTAGDAWIKKELGEAMEEPRTAMVLAPPPPPIAVPPMHPFLEHPGEPPEQWAHWIAQFDTFWMMVTIGRGSSYTEQDKSRYLELMLGTEGRRLVRHTPGVLALETSSHDAYRTAVRDILVPKTSPFRAIATFLARKQRLGESIQQFMADLRDLAAKCPFTVGEEDFWVASALAIGCQSERARERLFTLDKVDLGRVVDILLSDQSVRADLQATQTGSVGAFQQQQRQIARSRGRGGASRGRGRGSGGAAAAPQSRTPPTCGNCGGSHVTNAGGCLAQGKTCHRCGRVGHLKKFCRGAPAVKQMGGVGEPLAFNQDQGGYIGGIGSGAAEKYTATLDAWTGKLWTPVTWEVDTGASVTTLRMADVEALQLYLPLHPPKPLYLYDRTKMSGIRGTINLSVRLGQRTADTEVYVVQNQCSSVIGRDLLGKLNVTIKCAEGQIQALKAADALSRLGARSKAVGVDLKRNVMGTVSTEACAKAMVEDPSLFNLKQYLTNGWPNQGKLSGEPVQRSQWVHGLVTVAKNTGGVRRTRSYRATPRAGGKSPAEQFLGRKIRAPFMPNPEQPARRTEKQAEEAWKDKGARFQPGDRVGTRLPQRDKGLPGYQGPKTVERVLGRYTFILSDGKKWGFRKLTAWPEGYPPFVPALGSDAVGARTKEGTAQRQTVRRSQRQRREPQRFDSLQERNRPQLQTGDRQPPRRAGADQGGPVVFGRKQEMPEGRK